MTASPKNWGKLADLCARISDVQYVTKDRTTALTFLPELEKLLRGLPNSEDAIIRAEGFAIYHELREEIELAIEYRNRELELMNRLFDDIKQNNYNEMTKAALLRGRDHKAYESRLGIIEALKIQHR